MPALLKYGQIEPAAATITVIVGDGIAIDVDDVSWNGSMYCPCVAGAVTVSVCVACAPVASERLPVVGVIPTAVLAVLASCQATVCETSVRVDCAPMTALTCWLGAMTSVPVWA